MRRFSPILCALLALTICPSFSFAQADEAARSNIIVNVSPDTATAVSSETVQFTALVKNTPHAAVTWTASAENLRVWPLSRS